MPVHTRNQELVPVAHVKTHRAALPVIGADGTVLAEFSDDRVESRLLLEPAEDAAWREWEKSNSSTGHARCYMQPRRGQPFDVSPPP